MSARVCSTSRAPAPRGRRAPASGSARAARSAARPTRDRPGREQQPEAADHDHGGEQPLAGLAQLAPRGQEPGQADDDEQAAQQRGPDALAAAGRGRAPPCPAGVVGLPPDQRDPHGEHRERHQRRTRQREPVQQQERAEAQHDQRHDLAERPLVQPARLVVVLRQDQPEGAVEDDARAAGHRQQHEGGAQPQHRQAEVLGQAGGDPAQRAAAAPAHQARARRQGGVRLHRLSVPPPGALHLGDAP
jgi:hypothetical protein